ncbi:MAG: lysine--tRNA ligase [Chloroflexi bacterium HGW-Chloroflexi-1]|nr:MAG: lysine--tRNA ligase [Chloroflexi bacterium HGW-Chloroflexi-1]
MDELELNEQQLIRRDKAAELRGLGVDPYPARLPWQRTHTAAEAIAAYERGDLPEGQPITLVGRLLTLRLMGKAAFAHIEDGSGRIQIYVKRDVVGETFYNTVFKRLIDLGDFVALTGAMFTTRTGEITCQVTEMALISKTMNPLPDKWHGLKDTETRYRQRYVDLLANTEVRAVFRTRARIIAAIRRYLDGNGFLEVETPVLQPIYGGAAARPFTTFHNQLGQELFLRISFELYLKRLLVGGYERVYEIGRDFRNEGISFKHNPEFTQLEFYEAYTDYHSMMRRVEEMLVAIAREVAGGLAITYGGHEIDLTPPWRRITMRDAIRETTGIDYTNYPDVAALAEAMRAIGHQPEPRSSRGKLIDSLFSTHVEPALIQPTFIIDYPIEISPLAKKKAADPTTVERFEYFIGGLELGNAFSELNDPDDQRARFVALREVLADDDENIHPLDEDFLNALSYGLPPTGGFGTGIDRLTMLFTDRSSIREVILFPHLRSVTG